MRDDHKYSHAHGTAEQGRDFQVDVSLKHHESFLKKSFIFDADERIWYAKLQVINELAKGVKDVFNYGFYEPPKNGRSGKFLDEERTLRDYPQRSFPVELEFKYKRRVYKSLQYDQKTLHKVHTKSNLKKLLECVTSNNIEQVSKWTEKGLDPNFQDEKTGETPLTIAVSHDERADLIATLVNGGAHLDYRAGDGLTPMHKAAIAGKPNNVKILLDLGCSPNVKSPKGLTPLYCCVLRGGSPYCTELLLNEHAEMGVADHQGMQEIHHACKKGLVQHLEHLVFYGANTNATTASGNTPLHITALSNNEECARVLLFRGASRDILNFANQSAYEVAAVAGNKELAEFIRTFSDGQIVKFTEKPTYSTRRRKVVQKPTADSLFVRSDSYSNKSDSSASPRSMSGRGHRSNSNLSLDDNGPMNGGIQRSSSVCSTTSESSYTSDPEDVTVNERRSRAQQNRSRDVEPGKMAPPVKIVSGAASVRKRLYAANASSKQYIGIKDYVPSRSGELQIERGDIVEVLYVGERGFWEGRIDDRAGWFPGDCVEELKKGEKQRPKTLFGRPPSFSAMFARNEDPRAPTPPDHRFIQPPRVVVLNRGKAGFGFQMRGANCQTPRLNFKPSKEFPALQYIGEVEPGGEAYMKGVRNDDFIIEVNNEDVTTATHSHVVNLIKRSGNNVKLKIVTVPPNVINGVDTLDGTDGGKHGSSRKPPPLPQRDPSTTLTLGRMRTNSRPSLFDAGLVHSHEEPPSFKVDSVIAVSKDSPWSTLQRRKPSNSSSRSAAQFKFNGGSKNKYNDNSGMTSNQRSRSMQNIASLSSSSYDSDTIGRAARPKSTAVPFAIPKVPDRDLRSMSHGDDTLTRHSGYHGNSDPNLVNRPVRSMSHRDDTLTRDYRGESEPNLINRPVRSMSHREDTLTRDYRGESDPNLINRSMSHRDDTLTRDYRGDSDPNLINRPVRSMSHREDTIAKDYRDLNDPYRINKPVRSLSHVEDTLARPRDCHGYSEPNLIGKPLRSMSVDESSSYNMRYDNSTNVKQEETIVATPVSTIVNYVEDPPPRVEARSTHNDNIQDDTNGESTTQRGLSVGSNDSLTLRLQRAVEARNERINKQDTIDRKMSAPANVTSQRRRAHTGADRLRSDIMSQLDNTQLSGDTDESNKQTINTSNNVGNTRNSGYLLGSVNYSNHSNTSPSSSPSKSKGSPKKAPKPVIAPKAALTPPPPPTPPIAPPLPVESSTKHAKSAIKGKKVEIPQTAVRQGLITVDALQAKKGKLKSVQNNQEDTPKTSKSIQSMVGRLAGQGGRGVAKPAPVFGGDQHANMLAKAVAARAAKMASEKHENELDSPSSWEDEISSPNIPRTSTLKIPHTSPKKTPPPVAPKKVSGTRKYSPRPMENDVSPGKRSLFPAKIIDQDRDYSAEEDRTMMMFDDIIRKEVESENWSLNSWNSSDSSSLAEGVLPPGTCSVDERPRKSSFGSGSRPWYEYSSGSPSEESLNASSERISQLRPTLSIDDGARGNRVIELSRRSSEEDQSPSSTLTRDINLEPVHQKVSPSVSISSIGSDEIINSSHPIDNRSANINGRYTPTNNVEEVHESTLNSPERKESSEVMEKIISTPKGVIKLRLQAKKSPNKNETQSVVKELPPTSDKHEQPPLEGNKKSPIDNYLPPPPMDFVGQDEDGILTPLPPPPEFFPLDDFNSPLPAPPVDFCDDDDDDDDDRDHGSSLDVPSVTKTQPSRGLTFEDKPMMEWTCEDVCDWLDSLNLPQYKDTFRDNDIQGLHLPELTKAELLELGIKSLGHRMTMENSVAKLCHPVESSC